MFFFKISFWDEDSAHSKVIKTQGLVVAENFSGAVLRITEYYGEDNIISIDSLYELEDIIDNIKVLRED